MGELIEAFNEYFEIVPANTPELQAETFRLRYEVICEEMEMPGYERWKYPDKQEKDEDDDRASHCLLRRRPTGTTAGTVRLIMCDPHDPDRPFPIETRLQHMSDPHVIKIPAPSRPETAEISRLILAKRFRSRRGEDQNEFGAGLDSEGTSGPRAKERRYFPHAVLGLMTALFHITARQRIRYWYAMGEPKFNRLLKRFALELTPIGPVVEYHGMRQPHFDPIMHMLARTYHRRPDVWELVTKRGKIVATS